MTSTVSASGKAAMVRNKVALRQGAVADARLGHLGQLFVAPCMVNSGHLLHSGKHKSSRRSLIHLSMRAVLPCPAVSRECLHLLRPPACCFHRLRAALHTELCVSRRYPKVRFRYGSHIRFPPSPCVSPPRCGVHLHGKQVIPWLDLPARR